MNIFITGGAGYIGSATAEALIKAGHQVTGHPIPVNELARRPGDSACLAASSDKILKGYEEK